MRKNLPVTQQTIRVKPGQRLITTTDTKGLITYANEDFVDISGFSAVEIIGQPQNIIRHPDVPPAVFAHMWNSLKSGRSWMGIVKNRAKSGDNYWVNAYVMPVIEQGAVVGYESVRVMATPQEIQRATRLYERLNSNRRAIPIDWRAGLSSLLPGMLAASVASASVYSFGFHGIIAGIILGAPIGFVLQRRREKRLNSEVAADKSAINDSILAQMYTDEPGAYGRLQTTLISSEARLRMFLGRVEDYTRQLERQASQGAVLAQQSLTQLERQQTETHQVAAAINEMSAASHEVAGHVVRTAEASRIANDQADKGMAVVDHARQSMETLTQSVDSAATVISELADGAEEIGAVVDVIHGIADQTNLLALNAAIEAARAGEAGRGFAVVADEVRSLAKSTAESTEEINRLISNLQNAASRAVAAMDTGRQQAGKSKEYVVEANDALDHIMEAIRQVGQMSEQIASAAEEQSCVAEEINRSITSIAVLSESTAAEARRHHELSNSLAATATNQTNLISRFTKRDHSNENGNPR